MRISDLIKIDPRPISIARDEILCFVAVKNELVRLPHFLDYYRRLGVHRFIFVDSASNDGLAEYFNRSTVFAFRGGSTYLGFFIHVKYPYTLITHRPMTRHATPIMSFFRSLSVRGRLPAVWAGLSTEGFLAAAGAADFDVLPIRPPEAVVCAVFPLPGMLLIKFPRVRFLCSSMYGIHPGSGSAVLHRGSILSLQNRLQPCQSAITDSGGLSNDGLNLFRVGRIGILARAREKAILSGRVLGGQSPIGMHHVPQFRRSH